MQCRAEQNPATVTSCGRSTQIFDALFSLCSSAVNWETDEIRGPSTLTFKKWVGFRPNPTTATIWDPKPRTSF